MKINLKNTCYPKPLLSSLVDDYKYNKFLINVVQKYDKENQKLNLSVTVDLDNDYIIRLIDEKKIAIILHLEQKSQRQPIVLNQNGETEVSINLYKYATTEPIEVVAILYTIDDFDIADKKILNEIYGLLDDNIHYERGDIVGYSNELQINLPEDKRIGSIFNLGPDNENMLKGQPFKIYLSGESDLIRIIMDKDIHDKYVTLYKRKPVIKRLMFFNIVEPAIISAYTEMFMSYETYKECKWCRTLASKVEKKLKIQGEDIFRKENYELDKVYEYTNYALGDLFKDGINVYSKGVDISG